MGNGVEQVGALAYHRNMDTPAQQSLGWHLWQVPTTGKPPVLGLQQPHLMRECQISNFTLTKSAGLEVVVKVSRPAGVLWISSAGSVVILLLLNNDRRDKDGQRRITNGCLNVTLGVNQRSEGTEKDC